MLLRVALHNGRPGPHLGHDTPCPPHVNLGTVVPLPQKEFWWPVPQGHDSVSVSVRLTSFRSTECTRETKVSQFESTILCDEDVGCFHVTVEDLVAVDEVEAVEQLLHDLLNLPQRELHIGITQQTGQVMLTELEDEVECALEAVVWSCYNKNKQVSLS